MNAPLDLIRFSLNGRQVDALPGETVLQVARREGVEVPHLCAKDGLDNVGNCRACVVEVQGERALAASCCRLPKPGMVVATDSPRAQASQRMVLELLASDMPAEDLSPLNEVKQWAEKLQAPQGRFPRREALATPQADDSHPAIAVNLSACIQCTRCLRACRDEQGNDVIGLSLRGSHAKIVFDMDDAMGASSCVACGECVQACPTGALAPSEPAARVQADRTVDSLCPFCGVGCQMTYHVKDERIVKVEGRDGPANLSRLCVKGRFGHDYIRHPHRLTTPLIRRDDAPKNPQAVTDPSVTRSWFREASWEEALERAGGGLRALRDAHGKRALAGFGSAKGSNEEAYLFQKLVRTGFGSNNVDHCTRLCHASSVSALLEGIGSGAVSNPVMDVTQAEVVIIIGANPTVNHPVAATWIKNAAERGTKLVVMDPRGTALSRHAWRNLHFRPDTDVAMLNALMHVIVEENLVDPAFIAQRTEGFDDFKAHLQAYSPEAMAPICGIEAETLREVARAYATSQGSMILWGMGITQHVHGTDNARCLIALALMTGQIGRPGSGLHPLRGQNNVQGASDAGLIPMMFPDYHRVGDAAARSQAAQVWGVPEDSLDTQPGLTVVEVMHAALHGDIRGMVIMGENPAMSDPDANHAREALSKLDLLVVQDLFLTETAALADVVLPASALAEKWGTFTNTDRTVQLARPVLGLPGEARQDLWILTALAEKLGLDWSGYQAQPTDCHDAAQAVFNEMRQVMGSIAGITWARLEDEGAVTYPCTHEGDPGTPVVFTDHFPTPSGRARFVPADIVPANERPDADYPLILITGRQLEHWHTGSMTRRSAVLDAIEPDPVVFVNPEDLQVWGLNAGDPVRVQSRRGEAVLYARADDIMPRGVVFAAFCWAEAAINRLTNPALDPTAKIPELKYCAVRLQASDDAPHPGSFGAGQVAATQALV